MLDVGLALPKPQTLTPRAHLHAVSSLLRLLLCLPGLLDSLSMLQSLLSCLGCILCIGGSLQQSKASEAEGD